jgi:hypothetical protein
LKYRTPKQDRWKEENECDGEDVERLSAFLFPEHANVLEIGRGSSDLPSRIAADKKSGEVV